MFETSKCSGKEGVAAFRDKRAPAFNDLASCDMPAFFYPWWDSPR